MNSRLGKILIALVVIILFISGVWFFFFLDTENQEDVTNTVQNLFPFGEITSNGQNQNNGNQGTIGGENTNSSTGQETVEITEPDSEGPRLRKISSFPTGGFTPIIRTEQQEISDIEIDAEGNTLQTVRIIDVENQYVRYSEIANANIHESQITPSEIVSELLVENFIPNAEYSYFNNDGTRALFQYWNASERTPETYLARIEEVQFTIDVCPFDFPSVAVGDDNEDVIGLHQFLNRIPQTRIARSGINSPGNESSLATEATITGVKNFQSLYQIDIDGNIGSGTRSTMLQVCNEQQERIARAEFEQLEEKHTISGFFLPQNITQITLNPNGEEVFYIQEDEIGVIGVVRNLLDETRETIFESPFSEWLAHWNNNDSIEITTKPSFAVDGFSYQLNPDTGRYFKSLSEKKGLTTLASPNNRNILTMESVDNSTRLSIHNRDSNRTRAMTIQTFVEKCVWSPNSDTLYCAVPNSLAYGEEYPDIWYQGLETYTDSLWRIDARTLEETVISDINTDYGESIDVEFIDIDPKNEYLYFIDKTTEHLWSYRLVDF